MLVAGGCQLNIFFACLLRLLQELQGDASDLENPLQTLIESNLEPLLGIRFLATEYSTGKIHAGRVDTLGLDENNYPVILEYKRSTGENVINQGLFLAFPSLHFLNDKFRKWFDIAAHAGLLKCAHILGAAFHSYDRPRVAA